MRVAKDPFLQPLFDAIDSEYKQLIEAFRQNERGKIPVSHPARAYLSVWEHVSFLDDEEETLLLFKGSRIIVPKEARAFILARLHTSHQGIVKTRLLAQENYFWPGMLGDVKHLINHALFAFSGAFSSKGACNLPDARSEYRFILVWRQKLFDLS